MTQNSSSRPSVVVIGAGPYGLAIGAHLRGLGVDARVFGEPLESWRSNMPKGMALKSDPSASSISAPHPGYRLEDYCRSIGVKPLTDAEYVPAKLFIDYGRWFQEQLVPLESGRISCVTRAGDGFDVVLDSGERLQPRTVVMAAGHVRYAHVPPAFDALADGEKLPTPLVSHTCHHPDLSVFAGKSVAVVGRGQSALESAALLHEQGATPHVLVRADKVLWAGTPPPEPRPLTQRLLKPPSGLGPGWSHVGSQRGAAAIRHLPARTRLALVRMVLGPAGSWWLRERYEGIVDTRLDTVITAAAERDDQVDLTLRTSTGVDHLTVDHVLLATGYKVDVDRLEFLDPAMRRSVTRVEGFPALDTGFQSSVPGLYFAGLSSAATFGPLMRFVVGTEFAAPRLARAVADRG